MPNQKIWGTNEKHLRPDRNPYLRVIIDIRRILRFRGINHSTFQQFESRGDRGVANNKSEAPGIGDIRTA